MAQDTIQWFPGHMAKARKLVQENLKLVDVVVELLDARIPMSSRNPVIDNILGDKLRVIVLNKSDLADKVQTDKWEKYFRQKSVYPCIAMDSQAGKGINALISAAQGQAEAILQRLAAKGRRPRPVRMMMVGIPNVGKSSLINRLAGKGVTKTADRPGVTKGKQWIKVGKDLELLDTPGILWPKFEDPEVGFKLAVTGAIKDEIINIEQVTLKLIQWLSVEAATNLCNRYKLAELAGEPIEILKKIGAKRGHLIAGGHVDTQKTAIIVLNEFRAGKIGSFTLDVL